MAQARQSMAQARRHRLKGTGSKAQARRHRLEGTGLMAQARCTGTMHRHYGRGTIMMHISNRTTQLKSFINIGVSASTEWQDIYPFCSKRVTHQLNLPQPTRLMSCLKCLCKLNARSKHRRGWQRLSTCLPEIQPDQPQLHPLNSKLKNAK